MVLVHLEDAKGFFRNSGPIQGRHAQAMPTAGSTEYQMIAGTAYPVSMSAWCQGNLAAAVQETGSLTREVFGERFGNGQQVYCHNTSERSDCSTVDGHVLEK